MIPCLLLTTPVIVETVGQCYIVLAEFTNEYRLVPRIHQNLVDRIVVVHSSHSSSNKNGVIQLRLGARPGELLHEVGHQVSYQRGIQEKWDRRFWPGGQPRGKLLSGYARTNSHEDFAETYRLWLQEDPRASARLKWIRDHL